MKVAFYGLGTMGLPMASTLTAAGFDTVGYDVEDGARERLRQAGGKVAASSRETLADVDAVVTMLPEGQHVRALYEADILPASPAGALLVDCSTIDVETSRSLAQQAADAGRSMIDAPVSGGPEGAAGGSLSFMVGGEDAAFARARPLLEAMGQRIVHFGGPGTGQAAKACHNMICGITALAVCESFALAGELGLDPARFYDLCRGAAAQSWILENRCPVPGVAAAAPASNDYQPGFAAALMAKDLRLAQMAAAACGVDTPFGREAAARFTDFAGRGHGGLDFSAIYREIAG